jgi:hypothetical protein
VESDYRDVALTIVAAVIVSLIISTALEASVVPYYLHSANRGVGIFDFYERVNGSSNNYFIGSSQIMADVEASTIENSYNLGLDSDTPLRRLIDLPNIIQSKPRSVIIGMTYYELNDTTFDTFNLDDSLLSVTHKSKLNLKDWFSQEELNQIRPNPIEYNRKFIVPALLLLIDPIHYNQSSATNFICPYNISSVTNNETLINRLNNERWWLSKWAVSEKDCRQKRALNYTIHELGKAGIKVAILNMPLHPLMSAKISNETRHDYFNFLNSTGVEYYDFEKAFQSMYFADLTHLNSAGRKHFTEMLCPIVL